MLCNTTDYVILLSFVDDVIYIVLSMREAELIIVLRPTKANKYAQPTFPILIYTLDSFSVKDVDRINMYTSLLIHTIDPLNENGIMFSSFL